MNGVNNINIDYSKKLFDDNEYQLYRDTKVKNNREVNKQITMYCNEMGQFPLIPFKEEKRYFKMIENPEDKKLLLSHDNGNLIVTNLNIPLLFYSLENNGSYQMIISDLIKFFGKLDSNNDKTIDILKKYLAESNKHNRALNSEEINNIFHIQKVNNILEEKELLYELKEFMNYKFAFEILLLSNLRLVISIAKKFYSNMNIMDLINIGNIALMKAVQKYDGKISSNFAAYASKWISVDICRAVMSNQSIVKIPIHICEDFYKFKKELRALEKKENKTLTKREISIKLGISLDLVVLYCNYMAGEVYIDGKNNEDDDRDIKDTIADVNVLEEEVLQKNLKNDIKILFSTLNEREKMVIKMYYGLDEYEDNELSIIEIGKLFNVDRQRIYQIRNSALVKMKALARNDEKAKTLRMYVR